MSQPQAITLTFDRRLLEHPRAYHLRRMRLGVWLYLDLLARLEPGADTLEVEPAAVAAAMGLSEATVRSWLGHLRKAGYVDVTRLNGALRLTLHKGSIPEPFVAEPPARSARGRFFTVERLQRALGEGVEPEPLAAALKLYPDPVIRKALAGALAPPEQQIRRSRVALFLYLLKHHHAPS